MCAKNFTTDATMSLKNLSNPVVDTNDIPEFYSKSK